MFTVWVVAAVMAAIFWGGAGGLLYLFSTFMRAIGFGAPL
jgi:hypothetical protein